MREFDLLFLEINPSLFAYLHNGCVLPDPVMERGGKLFKLFKLGRSLSVEQRVAWGRLGEHIVQLGNIGDDGLLVWFGGINICKKGNV